MKGLHLCSNRIESAHFASFTKKEKPPGCVRDMLACRYRFLTREEEVEELRHLEKGDVVEAYRKYLVPESKKRRRLAVHVHGKKYAMELQGQCPAHDTAIQDPEQLRGSLAQYP